jgi:hypothetical protein
MLCALTMIVFHALVETFIESTQGSILAARYLAASSVLIFISLTILISDTAMSSIQNKRIYQTAVIGLLTLMLVQSTLIWHEARQSWASDLDLWQNSWNAGSRSQLVASNLSVELMAEKKFRESAFIASSWLNKQQPAQASAKLCALYDVILKDHISLHDDLRAKELSLTALPVAWCNIDLAQNTAFILMNQQCPQVLSMLKTALFEGNRADGTAIWKYANVQDRIKLVSLGAYTEARCGDQQSARRLLQQLAQLDPEWASDKPLAKSLLDAAHSDGASN